MNSSNRNNFFQNLRYDIPSGLVVFLVALPLCLGIAFASGADLFPGLIAGIVGGIVIGSLSGSHVAVSGPAAGLTVIVAGSIESLGAFEIFLLALVFAGALQVLFGFIRFGIIAHFIPSSVIKGMLAAIGIILIMKQLPHALGIDRDVMGSYQFWQKDGENTISELFNITNFFQPGAMIISLAALLVMVLWDKPFMAKLKLIPSAVIAVLAGVALNEVFRAFYPEWALSGNHLVQIPVAKDAQSFFGQFKFPDWSAFNNSSVYFAGFTIALVASLETLLSIEATDKLDHFKRVTPVDRELKAQGVGNMVSGLIGGLPITAVIVRSSANINAGARSKTSAIFHGMLLLLTVITIPHLLNQIPLAALAAILLVVGYKLTKVSLYLEMYRLSLKQFIPFVVTVIAIVFTDLLTGIMIGLAVAAFFILHNNYKSAYYYFKDYIGDREHIRIELSEDVSFLNKASMLLMLDEVPSGTHLIIDGTRTRHVDYDVLEILKNFRETAYLRNVTLEIRGIVLEDAQTSSPKLRKALSLGKTYRRMLDGNEDWRREVLEQDPDFFHHSSKGQSPDVLWIGCSDSRVPPDLITKTRPGELFVHRNIANLVIPTDLNLLSVTQYAVDVLKVNHVIVCGHYGCGGVLAAMGEDTEGPVDQWLSNIRALYRKHRDELATLPSQTQRANRMVELNVMQQVKTLSATPIIQKAGEEREIHIHAWVYDIAEGSIKELALETFAPAEIHS